MTYSQFSDCCDFFSIIICYLQSFKCKYNIVSRTDDFFRKERNFFIVSHSGQRGGCTGLPCVKSVNPVGKQDELAQKHDKNIDTNLTM